MHLDLAVSRRRGAATEVDVAQLHGVDDVIGKPEKALSGKVIQVKLFLDPAHFSSPCCN